MIQNLTRFSPTDLTCSSHRLHINRPLSAYQVYYLYRNNSNSNIDRRCYSSGNELFDMISEDPKYSKIKIFWVSAPDYTGVAYSASPDPYLVGRGIAAPIPNNDTRVGLLGPSGLAVRVSGCCRVGNPITTSMNKYLVMLFALSCVTVAF